MTRAVNSPTRSRALTRSRAFGSSLLNHLTQRDVDICVNIHEHRFLTTRQIFEIHFTSEIRARVRCHQLFELGVFDRFRPPQRPGSAPWHYVLDRLGIEVVSGVLDTDIAKSYFDRNRPYRLARSPRLIHMRDVNSFFSSLIFAVRQRAEYRVTRWWGERKAAANCTGIVHPDGIAKLVGPPEQPGWEKRSVHFFLELDRGTEESARIASKIADYEEAIVSRHLPRILLLSFPSERRESYVRDAVGGSALTIATAIQGRHISDPLGANWLPIGWDQRIPVIDLPTPDRFW